MAEVELADRLAIEALVTEYAWLLDHHRWHEVADLCTDDAVLRIRGREIVGRPGLLAWADYRATKQENRKTQHQMTLLRLEQAGPDEVAGTVALVLHTAKSGSNGTYVDLVGEYRDQFVRTPDGWRFGGRRLVPIGES